MDVRGDHMVFRKIRRGGAKGAVDVEGGHMVFRKLGGGGKGRERGGGYWW